jgi:PAS domain S-box
MKILIVDDGPTNLKLLRLQLEADGHEVLEAVNGIEALKILEHETVDGIVSDILMPRMDGYLLSLEVRKDKRFSHIPLVLYTSTYNSPTDRVLARNAGADAYISKPAPTDVIIAALQAAAGKPRSAVTSSAPQDIESPILRQYSETLVRKLEDKSDELERAYQELEQTEARLSGLIESALDAIVAFDEQQKILLFNAAAETMFGYKRATALQSPLSEFLPLPFCQTLAGEPDSGQTGPHLLRALRRDGSEFTIEATVSSLDSSQGRIYTMFIRDITERERVGRALHESEERFRSLIEASQDWIWEVDREGRLLYTNNAVQHVLGYSADELLGHNVATLIHPEDRASVAEHMASFLEHPRPWQRQPLRWRHRDGGVRILESTANPVLDIDGRAIGYRGANHDDTERLAQEARISRLVHIHAVLSAIGNIVVRASDRSGLLHNACRVAVDHGGFKAACIGEGTVLDTLRVAASHGDAAILRSVAPDEPMPVNAPGRYHRHPGIEAFREKHKIVIGDFAVADVPAELRQEMKRAGVMSEVALPLGTEPWGVLTLFSESARDYDEEEIGLLEQLAEEIDHAADFIAKSERLEYLAYHNSVTGLPNRSAFREHVQSMLACGPIIVCVLNIRRFAYINDSRGRAFGDHCLEQIGIRLRRIFATFGFVAHPEGSTFLLAYPITDRLAAEIERLHAQLRRFENQAFTIDGEEIYINPQSGVAIAPQHGDNGEILERNGMSALAEAERRDELLYVFSENLQGRATRRLKLEHDLRHALDQGEFELFYQPKFFTVGNRLLGAEALLRWRRSGELIQPAEFISVLEETGLIVPVGQYVLRDALAHVMDWRARYQPGLRIAVNVSARELRYSGFIDQYSAILEPYRADQGIDIEITESLLMDDIDHNIPLLEKLRELGCHISIDDFGTGYSSLNYLTRLPADEIKIDQSFIATLTQSPETMGMITNIINLAHSLSLRVVAEGVENEEQAKLLHLLRCDVLQGYFLGRPMPADVFEEVLANLSAPPAIGNP